MDEGKKEEKFEATSFNITAENLDWLRKVNDKLDRKSVSNTLNYILNNIRERKNKGIVYDE